MAGQEGEERDPVLAQHLDHCFEATNFPNDPPQLEQIYLNHDAALAVIPPELRQAVVLPDGGRQ